jgi:hypothetical protein
MAGEHADDVHDEGSTARPLIIPPTPMPAPGVTAPEAVAPLKTITLGRHIYEGIACACGSVSTQLLLLLAVTGGDPCNGALVPLIFVVTIVGEVILSVRYYRRAHIGASLGFLSAILFLAGVITWCIVEWVDARSHWRC